MPCYTPLSAYRSKEFTSTGKRGITFDRNSALSSEVLRLPCGQCIGCRLERSRQWAIRCMHEKRMHEYAYFITFTYSPDCLPQDMSLRKPDMQLFWKRLRKKYGRFRYYMCGEYGETNGRPHYHAIVYGITFPDMVFYKKSRDGSSLYVSERLDETWKLGMCVIGDVTFESAAYVARYIVDKRFGPTADEHYSFVDADGVIHARLPEYTDMSKGIGKAWFEKYGAEAYQHDSVIMNGREIRPPRYYDKLQEVIDPARIEVLKRKRRRLALRLQKADKKFQTKRGVDRRRVAHIVAMRRLEQKGKEL